MLIDNWQKLLYFEWSPPWHQIQISRYNYDTLSGIQSGHLSLTFDLAFHLTFSLACFLASWSHILIWHSFCVFSRRKNLAKPTAISRRKKSGEADSDFRAVKARQGPQKLSHCKSPARPTAIRNWQVQSSEVAQWRTCCSSKPSMSQNTTSRQKVLSLVLPSSRYDFLSYFY